MGDTESKRVRRTPEEARRVILDAAEASLGLNGPGGLRLQVVAKAAGVSHPTILHHFGSREGLIQALNQRAAAQLRISVLDMLSAAEGPTGVVALAFEIQRKGLAQRLVWLAQTGVEPNPRAQPIFEDITQALHAMRVRLAPPGATVDIADSRAVVHLVTLASFGDALVGSRLRRNAGETDEPEARARFEKWFAALLAERLIGQARS